MAQLYNYATKQWENHPDDDTVNAKVASGAYGLESGLKIPVINPENGHIFEMPTEGAAEAFKTGIRLATPTELKAHTENKIEESNAANYDMPITAAGAGWLRGRTFGTSDLALRALGLGEAAKQVEKYNPKASIGGELVGALGAPIPGAGLIKEAETGIKLGAEAALGTSKAAQIAAKVGSKTFGSAAEGMMYGLGSGISEAALGDPQDVVEHLVHGGSTGAIFGGLLGAGMGAAGESVPLFKELGKASYRAAESTFPQATKIVSDAAEKVAGIPAALKQKYFDFVVDRTATKHGEEAGQLVRDALKNIPETQETLANKTKISEFSKDLEKMEADAARELRQTESTIRGTVERTPAAAMAEEMVNKKEISADLIDEINTLTAKQKTGYDEFFKDIDAKYSELPGRVMPKLQEDFAANLEKLGSSKNSYAQAMADTINDRFASLPEKLNVPDEIRALRDLKRDLYLNKAAWNSFSSAERRVIKDMYDKTSSYLETKTDLIPHEIIDRLGPLNQLYKDNLALNRVLGAKADKGTLSQLSNILTNPLQREALDTVVNNIGDMAPQLKSIVDRIGQSAERREAIKEFRRLLDEKKSSTLGGKLSMDDALSLLNMFGRVRGSTEKFIERAKTLQEALTPDMSPADRYLRLKGVFGQSVDQSLKHDIAKLGNLKQAADRLDQLGKFQSQNPSLLPPAIAAFFGGPKAAGVVRGIQDFNAIGGNPLRTVKTLVTLERAANAGARKVTESINAFKSALLSDRTRRATTAYKVYGQSLPEARDNYAKNQEILHRMTDPATLANYLSERMPAMPGATMTQAAMMAHTMQMAQFLASKLPADPFQGQTMFGNQTGFIPSDAELAKFNRYVNAAQHPDKALESISNLSASQEEVETLKSLYPKTFQRLQNETLDAITKPGVTLSYPQRRAVSQIFDVPVDLSMRPDFIQTMQSMYAQKMPKDQGGRPEGTAPMKSIKIDIKPLESFQTQAQKVTNK